MIFKIFTILLFTSANALAQAPDQLSSYLKLKGYSCKLTQAQLNEQVTAHLDFNIQKLDENLKAQGSDVQSVVYKRGEVETGILEKSISMDFFVLAKVTVTIQPFPFQVRTTYYTDISPNASVAQGLWFPLKVADPGSGKLCILSRVGYQEGDRQFTPRVDMVFADPPRVAAPNILQVMDPAGAIQIPPTVLKPEVKQPEAPAAAVAPAAPRETPAPPAAMQSDDRDKEESQSEKRSARESRRHRDRHEYRRKSSRESSRRSERRRHRRPRVESSEDKNPSAASGAPPKPSGCTGDSSMWTSAACKLGIIK